MAPSPPAPRLSLLGPGRTHPVSHCWTTRGRRSSHRVAPQGARPGRLGCTGLCPATPGGALAVVTRIQTTRRATSVQGSWPRPPDPVWCGLRGTCCQHLQTPQLANTRPLSEPISAIRAPCALRAHALETDPGWPPLPPTPSTPLLGSGAEPPGHPLCGCLPDLGGPLQTPDPDWSLAHLPKTLSSSRNFPSPPAPPPRRALKGSRGASTLRGNLCVLALPAFRGTPTPNTQAQPRSVSSWPGSPGPPGGLHSVPSSRAQ